MPVINLTNCNLAEQPTGLLQPLSVFAKGMSDTRLRESALTPTGLFLAESEKLVHVALDAHVVPYAMLMDEKWFAPWQAVVDKVLQRFPDVPVHVVSNTQFAGITGYSLTRGALTAMVRPALLPVEQVVENARRIAILEDINNYANIGGIFRSAAALGVDAVLVTPSCHDPLFRRAARISKGTVFQVPWTYIGTQRSWAPEGIPLLHRLGFKVASLALQHDTLTLDDPELASQRQLALVLGAEGDGLAEETIQLSDWTVLIPMMHGVDSLNVGAASAVAFWELRANNPRGAADTTRCR